MQSFWLDFLTKQIPVIVVMGLGIIWQNRYFVGVIEKKDEIIKAKDEEIKIIIKEKDGEIKSLNEKLLTLTTNCINAFNRNSEVLDDLKDVINNKK